MPHNVTIKMDGDAIQDSAATIDVPDEGVLLAASLFVCGKTMDADGDAIHAEITFASSNSFNVNDVRTTIIQATKMVSVDPEAAAGALIMDACAREYIDFPGGMKVFAGERIHMHVGIDGGATFGECRAILVFAFKRFTARRR